VPFYSGGKPLMVEGNIFTITIPIPDLKAKNLIIVPDTTTVTTTAATTVTTTDKMEMIIDFCAVPRSRTEIQSHLGLKNKKHFIDAYLTPLIESNRLAMTIPDKPNSQNQKYVAII
jgi:ATP-dependent DNA helicase RecG